MTVIRYVTFSQLCQTLGCGFETTNRLLALVDIADFGEELPEGDEGRRRAHNARRVRLSESITCKRDLWDAIGRAGWVIDGEEGLARYRALRRLLADKHTEHPPEAALAALALEGPKATKHQIFNRLGGTFITIGPVMKVIDRELGRRASEPRRSMNARELPVEEFVRRFPQFADLEATSEDREFPGRPKPSAKLLGRVEFMRSPELAELTGLLLMVAPDRIMEASANHIVRMLEKLDVVADASEPALGDALVGRLWSVTIENRLRLPLPQRSTLNKAYDWMRNTLRRWSDDIPAARREVFERLIPPPLPETFGEAAADVEEDADREKGDRRAVTAEPISKRREQFLNIAELRFRQTDRLVDKVVSDLRRIDRALAAGEVIEFPVTVNDTHMVIRPDAGGIGNGSQTISVQIETELELWFQCARAHIAAGAAPSHSTGWDKLDAARRQMLQPRSEDEEPHVNGRDWTPDVARRLRVIYVATRPSKPGGERVEPFWTSLYRSRLFDQSRDITSAERAERKALVKAIGFDPLKAPVPGLVADTTENGKALVRAYRRYVSRERFILPAEELRHALAVGRVVLRPELMRGMRIGESSQARTDEGAFDFRKFDGKIFYYLSVVPKMAGGRSRRMVLDPTTVEAFERLRVISVERWFPDEGDMPLREYQYREKKLPAARYLLANETRTLIYAEMNLCLRILTIGVISSTSHSYKYGFAAMLKRGEAPDAILRRGLNHRADSPVSDVYAQFFADHQIDAFIAEQMEVSRKMELDYALLDNCAAHG
ncbi:MAG: hypothetical protein V4459_08485 [Pseudomonadota bacterium]